VNAMTASSFLISSVIASRVSIMPRSLTQ
jgi:hypothetical protein